MPHYSKIAINGGARRPDLYQQPPIPVRKPEEGPQATLGKTAKGLSLKPKPLSLFNHDVDPMGIFKQIFGKEVEVDETSGTVKFPSRSQLVPPGPASATGAK